MENSLVPNSYILTPRICGHTNSAKEVGVIVIFIGSLADCAQRYKNGTLESVRNRTHHFPCGGHGRLEHGKRPRG